MKIVQLLLCSLIISFMTVFTAMGQSTFTEHVKKQKASEGKIVIIQSKAIEDAVNGVKPKPAQPVEENKKKTPVENGNGKSSSQEKEEGENPDKNNSSHHGGVRRHKAMGYRIQIYTGGNSNKDKMQAYEIGRKCQGVFPMLSSYPRFINPRWTCRVGDFRNHEEAEKFADKIRAAKISKEIRIVKCEVNAAW